MANYLYNGVELPDINTIWDKETYPYAFIMFLDTGDATVSFSDQPIIIGYTTEPNKENYFGLVFKGQSNIVTYFYSKDTGYSYTGTNTQYHLQIGASLTPSDLTAWFNNWFSYDIVYDGTTYYETTDPVPVGQADTSKLYYLYNGYELPNIDTVWTNKETHPYAIILSGSVNVHYLIIAETASFANDGVVFTNQTHIFFYACTTDEDLAVSEGITPNKWFLFESGHVDGTTVDMIGDTIWTNHNILNTDNSVYLSASEPKVYNRKISAELPLTEGITNSNGAYVKVSNLTPSVEELIDNTCVCINESGLTYVTGDAMTLSNEVSAILVAGIPLPVIYNAPLTDESNGAVYPEKGIYFPADLFVGTFSVYYNSTSTEEPNTQSFDTRSFQIGIAVGMGLKGNFGSPIDTGVNSAFTKGVEIGQRIRGKGVNVARLVDGVLIMSQLPTLTDDGVIVFPNTPTLTDGTLKI